MSNQWRQLVIRHVPGLYQSPHIRAMVRQDSGALRHLEQEMGRSKQSMMALVPTQHLPAIRQSRKPRVRWQRLLYLYWETKPILITSAVAVFLLLFMMMVILLVSHA